MTATRLPVSPDPFVIRTDFENKQTWEIICDLIRAPVHEAGDTFFANVSLLDDTEFRNLSQKDLLERLSGDYRHSFIFVVDSITITHPEFPVLVIDLNSERGRGFRAVPSQVQAIENNLSISNMDFFEFADNIDEDGIFRGFR